MELCRGKNAARESDTALSVWEKEAGEFEQKVIEKVNVMQ